MARIADRYLAGEIARAFGAVSILLLLITFGGLLTDVLNRVSRGKIPAELVLTQMVLRVPNALTLLLPLASFVAVLMAFGRLYRDSEMAVLAASGFGSWSQLWAVFRFAIVLSVVLLWLGITLTPQAQLAAREQILEAQRNRPVAGLDEKRFVELGGGAGVVYLDAYDAKENRFSGLMLIRERDDELDWLMARSGRMLRSERDEPLRFALGSGERATIDEENDRVLVVTYGEASLSLPRPSETIDEEAAQSMRPISALLSDNSKPARVELDVRLAPALGAFLLALMAPILARSPPRQARYDRIVLAVVLYLAYNNLQNLARAWYLQGVTPQALGPHWTHALLFAVLLLIWLPSIIRGLRSRRVLAGSVR